MDVKNVSCRAIFSDPSLLVHPRTWFPPPLHTPVILVDPFSSLYYLPILPPHLLLTDPSPYLLITDIFTSIAIRSRTISAAIEFTIKRKSYTSLVAHVRLSLSNARVCRRVTYCYVYALFFICQHGHLCAFRVCAAILIRTSRNIIYNNYRTTCPVRLLSIYIYRGTRGVLHIYNAVYIILDITTFLRPLTPRHPFTSVQH